jgi:hypothetical protein
VVVTVKYVKTPPVIAIGVSVDWNSFSKRPQPVVGMKSPTPMSSQSPGATNKLWPVGTYPELPKIMSVVAGPTFAVALLVDPDAADANAKPPINRAALIQMTNRFCNTVSPFLGTATTGAELSGGADSHLLQVTPGYRI